MVRLSDDCTVNVDAKEAVVAERRMARVKPIRQRQGDYLVKLAPDQRHWWVHRNGLRCSSHATQQAAIERAKAWAFPERVAVDVIDREGNWATHTDFRHSPNRRSLRSIISRLWRKTQGQQ